MGRVAVGKFGSPGSRARSERLKEQIENQVETLLILVATQGIAKEKRYFGFQSRLSSIHHGNPSAEILSIAPDYYTELPRLWFTTSTPFVSCSLEAFCLSTNGRPLLDVIRECRTPSMLVEKSA
jgi:hypothetical protein